MKNKSKVDLSFIPLAIFMWPYALIGGITLKLQELKYKLEEHKKSKQRN